MTCGNVTGQGNCGRFILDAENHRDRAENSLRKAGLSDFTSVSSGAPTLTDLGSSFPVASTTNVLSLYTAAAPNGSDIGVRVVEVVSGVAVEFTITTDKTAASQLLSPRNYMNTRATAAAVAYDCSGVYVETNFWETLHD